MNKILTIIIPTYNMEKYLRRCLDSLIIDEEGMKQLEVLVINDGSKDSSSQIAHEYKDKYPYTFRVIDKENGNYGSCINRGLKEATGKYVKVLDADDWFDTKNFSKYLKLLTSIDVDLILTDFNNVNDEGIIKSTYSYEEKNVKLGIGSINELMRIRPVFYGQMHGFTYRTKLLIDMHYIQTEGISYTDQEWVSIPMTKVKSYHYCPLNVYQYLIGREGQTMDNVVFCRSIDNLMIVVLNIIEYYENNEISQKQFGTYIINQLKIQLIFIYSLCICHNCYPNEQLVDFDNLLSSHPIFYELTNTFNHDNFMYVNNWRSNKRKSLTLFGKSLLRIKLLKESIMGGKS